MNRKRFLDLAKVIVSLILIFFLLREIGLQETLEKLLQVHPGYLLAALIVALLGVVVRAYRWQVLLSALEVEVPLGQLTALYFIGFLFTNVLPTGFGGDRSACTSCQGIPIGLRNRLVRSLPTVSSASSFCRPWPWWPWPSAIRWLSHG